MVKKTIGVGVSQFGKCHHVLPFPALGGLHWLPPERLALQRFRGSAPESSRNSAKPSSLNIARGHSRRLPGEHADVLHGERSQNQAGCLRPPAVLYVRNPAAPTSHSTSRPPRHAAFFGRCAVSGSVSGSISAKARSAASTTDRNNAN